mmetsp:Transcript_4214/g.14821  ORF Transcript_4214/g.14821 Transcript_4214/m.14821 type:complete len:210 (-) Transcript_4214:18-647(-)
MTSDTCANVCFDSLPPFFKTSAQGCLPSGCGVGSKAWYTSSTPAAAMHACASVPAAVAGFVYVAWGDTTGPVCISRRPGRCTTRAMMTLSASVQSASPDRQAQCARFGMRASPSGATNVSCVAVSRHGIGSAEISALYALAAFCTARGTAPSWPRPPAVTNSAATRSQIAAIAKSGGGPMSSAQATAARNSPKRILPHGAAPRYAVISG